MLESLLEDGIRRTEAVFGTFLWVDLFTASLSLSEAVDRHTFMVTVMPHSVMA